MQNSRTICYKSQRRNINKMIPIAFQQGKGILWNTLWRNQITVFSNRYKKEHKLGKKLYQLPIFFNPYDFYSCMMISPTQCNLYIWFIYPKQAVRKESIYPRGKQKQGKRGTCTYDHAPFFFFPDCNLNFGRTLGSSCTCTKSIHRKCEYLYM